jgi:hypothetical protein
MVQMRTVAPRLKDKRSVVVRTRERTWCHRTMPPRMVDAASLGLVTEAGRRDLLSVSRSIPRSGASSQDPEATISAPVAL